MTETIFFSWQSDTKNKIGRTFIEGALNAAIDELHAKLRVEGPDRETELKIDKDTAGVAGSPPIVDTIFAKIDKAVAVLVDVTFSGRRPNGDPTPNPNVLIEYGYALKSRSYGRVIGIMNKAYGDPNAEQMPFDMRHLRRPIVYHLAETATAAEIHKAKKEVTRILVEAIEAVLELPRAPKVLLDTKPFEPQKSAETLGRFRLNTQPLGVSETRLKQATDNVLLPPGPVNWLRLMPAEAQGKTWKVTELAAAARGGNGSRYFRMFGWDSAGSINSFRAADGYGQYPIAGDPALAGNFSFIFRSGEIWGVDHDQPNYRKDLLYFDPSAWEKALDNYRQTLINLGVTGDFFWIAGMEETLDRTFDNGSAHGRVLHRKCVQPQIVVNGKLRREQPIEEALRPFYEEIFDACGLSYE